MVYLLGLFVAYIVGSIPTSYLIGKYKANIDIREHGSGNVGATNTLRVLGKKMGVVVLLIDMFKGLIAVTFIAQLFINLSVINNQYIFIALLGAAAICGHIWTIFLGFKGGKGVATTLGVFLGITPLAAIFSIIIFVLLVKKTKYVSISSLALSATLPIFIALLNHPKAYLLLSLLIFLLIVYTHRENIQRLISGKESKISSKP